MGNWCHTSSLLRCFSDIIVILSVVLSFNSLQVVLRVSFGDLEAFGGVRLECGVLGKIGQPAPSFLFLRGFTTVELRNNTLQCLHRTN